jgi:3-hydroxybutyryl-CoA dehydratase
MAYYADELQPGMSESFSKTATARDVELFAEVTGDQNPVHLDEAYAATTPFGGRVAHGALSVSYLSAVLGMKIPGPGTMVLSITTRFRAPVRIGDTVTAVCTVKKRLPRRCFLFECVCKVGDTVVVEGEALVMAPARP